ncbi:hypothetical protein MIMGU_mgv1a0260391mg, partial [Erythranthe guttata]
PSNRPDRPCLCGIAMMASYPIKNSSNNPGEDADSSLNDEL